MGEIAATRALQDACLSYGDIQQACVCRCRRRAAAVPIRLDPVGRRCVGYCYGDSTCGQRVVYQLGMTGIPVYNVRGLRRVRAGAAGARRALACDDVGAVVGPRARR